jgi:hypothetical protein
LPWAKKSQHHGFFSFQLARRTLKRTGLMLRAIAIIAKTLRLIANFDKRKAATSKDAGAA